MGRDGPSPCSRPRSSPTAKPSALGWVSQELCGLGLGASPGTVPATCVLPSGKWPQGGSRGSVGSPTQALSLQIPKKPWQPGCGHTCARPQGSAVLPWQEEGVRVRGQICMCVCIYMYEFLRYIHCVCICMCVNMDVCTVCRCSFMYVCTNEFMCMCRYVVYMCVCIYVCAPDHTCTYVLARNLGQVRERERRSLERICVCVGGKA